MARLKKAFAERAEEFRMHRQQSLLKRAESTQVTIEPDYVRSGSYIAHQANCEGYCNLVTVERCTCREFRGWGDCPHRALLLELVRQGSDMSGGTAVDQAA